jgi:exosortase E/protease (VPEID-CTERM system)
MSAIEIADRAQSPWRAFARAAGVVLLVLFELAMLDANYSFRDAAGGAPSPAWRLFNDGIQIAIYAGLYAGLAFGVLVLAQHRTVIADWLAAARGHRWWRYLAAHVALFLALLAALPLFQSGGWETPWAALALWLTGSAVMLACPGLALAPASFWRGFAARNAGNFVVAAIAGLMTWGAAELAQNSWHQLSAATLYGAHWILSLYEPGAFIDAPARILGAGDFRVLIDAPCSGYEGVGLVLMMLSFYIFAFRRDLRFPLVFALLPIGALTIWGLNLVRLALLVSIGAHVSPDIALNGFHSQAGWVMFLAVTISLMAVAHFAPVFRVQSAAAPAESTDPALHLAIALLAPFAALMAARIAGAVFGPEAFWIAAGVIALPTAVLWAYRRTIAAQLGRMHWESALVGLAVGAAWNATEPAAANDPLGPWLADQTPAAATAWMALRIFGFALIVPITEELVFRGYLHRALVRRRFEQAAPAAFGWAAFIVTSLLFGAMHGRWLAGALAGAAFALCLYRSKSVSGPITAHIAANGLIAAYAMAAGRWELL